MERASVRGRVRRIYYGWWIVLAGFMAEMLNGGLYFHGFSAYFVFLQREFGWSRTLISGAFSFARVESGFIGPLEGYLIDRFGPGRITRLGYVLFGLGFMLMSRVNSPLTYYGAFLVIAAGASLGGFMAYSTAITHWFLMRRARALGLAMTGMGIGGVLVPGLAWSLTNFGWRTTAFSAGLLIWAVGIPISFIIRQSPEKYGLLPDGASPNAATTAQPQGVVRASADDFSVREALRSRAFWFMSLGHASALFMVSTVTLHQIPHMVNIGLSVQRAASVVAVVGFMTIVGQVLGGFIGDRITKRLGIAACLLLHAAALVVLATATSLPQALLFAVLHGLAWGARGPMLGSMRGDYFGRRSYATITGFSSLINAMGMVSGPLVAAYLADIQGGSYKFGFLMISTLPLAGSILFVLARKPVRRASAASIRGS